MILNQDYWERFKLKVFFDGDGGGGGPGGDADPGIGASDTDTGNFGGMATGHGQSGYGDITEGKPGVFGGNVLGGIPGVDPEAEAVAAANAVQGNLAATLGIGKAGTTGQEGLTDVGSNAGNVASANGIGLAGLIGQTSVANETNQAAANLAASLGIGNISSIANNGIIGATLSGLNKGTASAAINAIAQAHLDDPTYANEAFNEAVLGIPSLLGKIAARTSLAHSVYSNSMPTELSSLLSIIGMPVRAGVALASLGAGLTGNLVGDGEPSVGVDGGPGDQYSNAVETVDQSYTEDSQDALEESPWIKGSYRPRVKDFILGGSTLGDILKQKSSGSTLASLINGGTV